MSALRTVRTPIRAVLAAIPVSGRSGSPRGLPHAVGSRRRCGVVVALESGELPIPNRPHVCLRIDKRAAGAPNRCLGVHQGYDFVVLGDELSWLERRVVDGRCKTTKPAEDCFLAFEHSDVRVVVEISGIN